MRRTNAGETLGLGFDHDLERVVSQSTLLLKIGTDGKQVVIGQGFMQKRPIRSAALGCGAECRYFTLSDLLSGRESMVLAEFSNNGIEPMKDAQGRTIVIDLHTRPDSFLIKVRYHAESKDSGRETCKERYFVLSKDGSKIRAITSMMNGCAAMN
ncbi:hypothetical protein [Burkholderia cepacia]|uniref:hypothetical protein n=1 Tax=Burkholderia cepacia TaxID=292 RepID=UPI00163A5CAE|nr:hypothetical protein [Burkholderia cepacia]